MTLKLRLKLTDRIRLNYTGMLGRYRFVNGVSTEEIPFNERIRIAANFGVVEIDADGNELGNPSPAVSTVSGSKARAALCEKLAVQTEEEKATENATIALGSEEKMHLLTAEAIEAVASKSGIAGLREIAGPWKVKSKSIPVLMQMIVDAQAAYIVKKREQLIAKGIPEAEIEALLMRSNTPPVFEKASKEATPAASAPSPASAPVSPIPPAVAEAVVNIIDVVKTAAETGDLAAALNAPKPPADSAVDKNDETAGKTD